jgi:hypothetical protein
MRMSSGTGISGASPSMPASTVGSSLSTRIDGAVHWSETLDLLDQDAHGGASRAT